MTDERRNNNVDLLAARYRDACDLVDELWKRLFTLAIRDGVRPKDAPRTRMLAGELYEVLATRSTRMEVDQKKAAQLSHRRDDAGLAFDERTVFDLNPGWERNLTGLPAATRSRLERLVRACLTARAAKRLTVRRRKARPSTSRRKAA